jgi:transposase-like protein
MARSLRGEASIAELCRREGIVQNVYYVPENLNANGHLDLC